MLADRCRETTTTTGTGTVNLAGAVTGFQTLVAGRGTGNPCYYAIVHQTAAEWEVGIGTITDATPDTLSRTTILSSSNAGSAVNFAAGTKDVFVTAPAGAAAFPAPVKTETGATYTYALADAGKYIRFTNAAGCAATIPPNSSVAFSIGTELHGLGTLDQVEIVQGSGVTVNTPETLFTAKAFAAFTAKKVATNEWDLLGYLEPA